MISQARREAGMSDDYLLGKVRAGFAPLGLTAGGQGRRFAHIRFAVTKEQAVAWKTLARNAHKGTVMLPVDFGQLSGVRRPLKVVEDA